MIHDYKNVVSRRQVGPTYRGLRWRWHGAVFFLLAALLVLFLVETRKSEASASAAQKNISVQIPLAVADNTTKPAAEIKTDQAQPQAEMATYPLQLPPAPKKAAAVSGNLTAPDDEPEWQTFIVKPGYNLAIICSRAGVKAGEVHTLMQLGDPVKKLKTLFPNDKLLLKILPDGTLAALQYDIDQSERLLVTRNIKRKPGTPVFKVQLIKRPLETRTAHASGIINDSLYLAAQRAGLSNAVTGELANLFGWDIDYTQQVRKGDRFTVVYEDYFRDGEKVDDSGGYRDIPFGHRIIAAEFINNGTVYRALRYTNPAGKTDYYTPDGRNLRKTFMRNPVDARVSSTFNPRRLHPLLHKVRPHRGVDYAAPRGTPIRATGDGKVVFHGLQHGYGRTIIIQHGQRYSTLYAHMSKFAKNTAKGRRVKQGQTIGYVGKSGLATGVHLHYEFRIDGVHHNPLTVKFPSVAPIPDQYLADFKQKTRTQVAQLDTLDRINLATEQHTSGTSSM